MPKVDFSTVDGISDFTPVPEGLYTCRLSEIDTDLTKFGDEKWKLRWTIESGEHIGRILFDSLVFSPKAMPRVKALCECLGLDVSGEVSLEPPMLLDRRALVLTIIGDYTDNTGAVKQCNQIPYDGYRHIVADSDDTPF